MTHKKNPSDQTNDIEILYKYNDSGIRTQKTVNGVTTNYHLVGGKVTFEENETDRIYYSYDNSDHLISMNLSTKNDNGTWTNGEEYFYIRNAQGDIIGLCDKSGAEVVSYVYDSWGKLVSIDGTLKDSVGVKNPYLYRGYRYDNETGLYYLQSRYYNPGWGRFINADAIIGSAGELLGHNVFAYCKNNFVNGKDPSGFRSIPAGADDDWVYEVPKTTVNVAKVVSKGLQYGSYANDTLNTVRETAKYDVPKKFGKNKGKIRIKSSGNVTYTSRNFSGITGQAIKSISRNTVIFTVIASGIDNYGYNNGNLDARFLMGTAIDVTSSLLIMGASTAIMLGIVAAAPVAIPGAIVTGGVAVLSLTSGYVVNNVYKIKERILD